MLQKCFEQRVHGVYEHGVALHGSDERVGSCRRNSLRVGVNVYSWERIKRCN